MNFFVSVRAFRGSKNTPIPSFAEALQKKPDLFKQLEEYGVPFVVIGGLAVNDHGFIRATEDVDIVFLRTPSE